MAWFLTTNAIHVTTGEKYKKFEKFQGFTSNQYVDTTPNTIPYKFSEYFLIHILRSDLSGF
jgi:hypothetical protein